MKLKDLIEGLIGILLLIMILFIAYLFGGGLALILLMFDKII